MRAVPEKSRPVRKRDIPMTPLHRYQPPPNEAHISAATHYFGRLGLKREAAEKIARLLGVGLWNRQQDTLLAMLASCQKAQPGEEGTGVVPQMVSRIHRRTE